MKLAQRQSGFTLIEMILTLGILTLILTVATVNFRTAAVTRQLRQIAEELRQAVYQTHALTLAPAVDKPIGSDGYRLHFPDEHSYEIWEQDVVGPTGTVEMSGRRINTQQLPADYRLTVTPVVSDIVFSTVKQGQIVAPQLAGGTLKMTVTHLRGDREFRDLEMSLLTGQVQLGKDGHYD